MQCIDPSRLKEHFRRVYENGDEVQDEANGKEEKIKFLQSNLIIRIS